MPEIPEDIKALEKKIEAMKAQKVRAEKRDDKHTDFSHLTQGLRLGVELASGTVVGAALGYILDEIFDFEFMMLLIFTIFGGCAGILNAYHYAKSWDMVEEKRGK